MNAPLDESDHGAFSEGGSDARLRDYYARRASEYERIYAKPERQADLTSLRSMFSSRFASLDVLEIACGTGYWTQVIGASAKAIVATDLNEEVLAIARHKIYPGATPLFRVSDAYTLDDMGGIFNAAFAGFWWSHVLKSRLSPFLECVHRRLAAGALVVFVDNNYVEGSNTPIARRDAEGNTYQQRRLEDGSEHEVLKNFPTEAELRAAPGNLAEDIAVIWLKYYWCLSYRIRKA